MSAARFSLIELIHLRGATVLNGLESQGWKLSVVRATPGTLPTGRQVVAVVDEGAQEVVYMVDTTAPEATWMAALGAAMTAALREWCYVGDVMRLQISV